jgi:hypothetical protein
LGGGMSRTALSNVRRFYSPRGESYILKHPGDLTVSKRTGTSNRIEIQFRTFNHLSRPDSFVKLFETLCLCLTQGNENLGQI